MIKDNDNRRHAESGICAPLYTKMKRIKKALGAGRGRPRMIEGVVERGRANQSRQLMSRTSVLKAWCA